jgi:hypothetical protein
MKMTFIRKILAIALAAASLGALAQSPVSAHEFVHFGHDRVHFGGERIDFRFHRGAVVDIDVTPVYKACPYGMHLGHYGHYCWPNRY